MDPLTQGLLGAVAAQAVLCGDRSLPRAERRTPVTLAGLAGGLLPDADVALQPLADPALPWELHRHFTHGIVMAPVMGALAALALLLLRPRWRPRWRLVLGAAVLGALTHAPLDLCTSYGTKILWPFSLADLTLDLFPIVDPLFTLVLLVGVVWAWRRGGRSLRPVGAFLVLYVAFALVQQHNLIAAFDGRKACWQEDQRAVLSQSLVRIVDHGFRVVIQEHMRFFDNQHRRVAKCGTSQSESKGLPGRE